MKSIKHCAVGVLLCVCFMHASAQTEKTLNAPDRNRVPLFSDLPEQMMLQLSGLTDLFDLPIGSVVSTPVSETFRINGSVVSKSDAADRQVQSVVVRSTNRKGATLTFTRKRNTDGTLSYSGRILSFQHGDAYEIVPQKGSYVLQKRNMHDLISE